MFTQVGSRKYYLQIVDQIRAQIAQGVLKPGDRLPTELELARMFGASRGSIREALSALEILGLIASRGSRGKVILAESGNAPMQDELFEDLFRGISAFDLFETRLELEPVLAVLAAERATPEQKEQLRRQLETLTEIHLRAGAHSARRGRIVNEYLEEDLRFHLLIGELARNQALYRIFTGVQAVMRSTHWRVLKRRVSIDRSTMEKLDREHAAIYEAIAGGRPDQARARMTEHIRDLKGVLV